MRAIAAMARNRIVGRGNAIPWRIPDEFRWFRRTTLGHVVVMGRRTFESLPKPLEGRVNVVLTRNPELLASGDRDRYAGAIVGAAALRPAEVESADPLRLRTEVRLVRELESLDRAGLTRDAWLCGGVQLYRQHLGRCSDLYLTLVDREVEGDASFPPFEHLFDLVGVVAEYPEFRVLHYVRNATSEAGSER